MKKLLLLLLSITIPVGILVGLLYYLSLSLAPIDQKAATELTEVTERKLISEDLEPFKYVQGEVVVVYKEEKINLDSKLSIPRLWSVHNQYDLTTLDRVNDDNMELVTSDKSTQVLIKELSSNPNVEYAQPNYQYQPLTINTNDPYKDRLWGLDNTGQTIEGQTSKADADIDTPEAWNVGTNKDSNVVVAIIDSGVGYSNPDLKDKMWNGLNCKNESGVLINGCIHGYDFEDNDKDPAPDSSSHGTHIAGTIAAAGNNGSGIIGVAPNLEIMAIKTDLTSVSIYKSIKFAKYNGADIINASFGGPSFDILSKNAIEDFGGLFVAAAGNSAINHSVQNFYPCDYDSSNVICVAATDQNDELAVFGGTGGSDYGITSVDIAAPGKEIYSSIVNSNIYSEDFDDVAPGGVPENWTASQSSSWGVKYLNPSLGNLLYGDTSSNPYKANANTSITSPKIDVSSANGVAMSFVAVCDTPYDTNLTDYMSVLLSKDGVNFELMKFPRFPQFDFSWNEQILDINSGDTLPIGNAGFYFSEVRIPSKFISSELQVRFEWRTDSSDNNYGGCAIDWFDMDLFSKGSENQYDFMSGTSMAAPHVAGVAGLMLSEKPTMSAMQVKSILMETGDALSSLQGKVVTGRRVNAQKAMIEVMKISPPTTSPTVSVSPLPSMTPSVVPTNTNGDQIACGKADVNNDGKFTIVDLQDFSVTYGTGLTRCLDSSNNFGACGGKDWNGDGKLNIVDFGAEQGFAKRYTPKNCELN